MTNSSNIVEPNLQEVSAGAVHALNNVLAVLFAASSYLDEAGDEGTMDRARQAVENACKAGQAVSAGLAILGVDAEALKAAADISLDSPPLERDEVERILEVLGEVGGVHLREGNGPIPITVIPLDREILQSLLICAAIALRREFGREIGIVCDAGLSDGRLVFKLHAEGVSATQSGFKNAARHPCSIAIEFAGAIFPQIGCEVVRTSPGSISIVLATKRAA